MTAGYAAAGGAVDGLRRWDCATAARMAAQNLTSWAGAYAGLGRPDRDRAALHRARDAHAAAVAAGRDPAA